MSKDNMSKDSRSKPYLPNPFDSAKRVPGVTVGLRPEDITDVWLNIDEDEAAQFLDQHAASIAAQMLAAGRRAAYEIMKQEGDRP